MEPEYCPSLVLKDKSKADKVENELKGFKWDQKRRTQFRTIFNDELEKGLRGEPTRMLMENTHISELPNGSEVGEYLALDLGATNFRVCLLTLRGAGKEQDVQLEYYEVPSKLRKGPGVLMFDFLAESIHDFLKKRNLLEKKLPLGFTYSFPFHQMAIDSGILISWANSFDCPDVVGKDAALLLKEAIKRQGMVNVEVVAILNDTTGTLMQGAFQDKRSAMGVILGSGYNVCYLEDADKIKKGGHAGKGRTGKVVVNTESSSLGEDGKLDSFKTEFDLEIDEKSIEPNMFTLEKIIGGAYYGELLRLATIKLAKEGLLFNGKVSDKLTAAESFGAPDISKAEEDNLNNKTENTRKFLTDLELSPTEDDIAIVKHICQLISVRTAIVASIHLSHLLERMARPETTIAIDGSLFKYHPRLRSYMYKFISDMCPGRQFELILAEEGSGKGAALVAAAAKA